MIDIKVGNMVEVTNDNHCYLNKGQIYKVIYIDKDSLLIALDIVNRNKHNLPVVYARCSDVKKINTELSKILYG